MPGDDAEGASGGRRGVFSAELCRPECMDVGVCVEEFIWAVIDGLEELVEDNQDGLEELVDDSKDDLEELRLEASRRVELRSLEADVGVGKREFEEEDEVGNPAWSDNSLKEGPTVTRFNMSP